MKNKIQHIITALALTLGVSYTATAQVTAQKIGTNPTTITPSAVLDIESTNKGVLFPRVSLTSTTDATTIASPATGLTVYNTASAGTAPNNVTPGYYFWNGTKWTKLAVETPPVAFAKTVYVNAVSPTSASIFDENNPPATNDNLLKEKDDNLYIGTDGSTWTYDNAGTAYKTYAVAPSTPFNLASTTTDAGNDKTANIWRTGGIGIGINNPKTLIDVSPATGSSSITVGTVGTAPTDEVALNFATKYDRTNALATSDNRGWQIGARGNAITGTLANSFAQQNAFHASFWNGTSWKNALTILPNGNVGFGGQTNPIHALDIPGTAMFRTSGTNILFSTGNTLHHSIRSRHYNSGGINALDFWVYRATDNAPKQVLTLQGDGNVGIGTNAPTAALDVNSITAAANPVNADIAMLKLTRPTNSGAKWGNVAQFNMGTYGTTGDALTRLDLGLNNSNTLIPSPVMTWQGNGNVGIGTTAPASKLEVDGAVTNKAAFDAGSSTTIDFTRSNLAYTTAAPQNTFTLNGLKDGGTYTLAVRNAGTGMATFVGGNPAFASNVFKSPNNGTTLSGDTLYTFMVMGTTVYFYMTTGL